MESRAKMERKVEERKDLDEEELKLRDETLRRTPSGPDRPKTESGIYAPEGGGQGMVPTSGEKEQDVGKKAEETAKRVKSSDVEGR